MTKPYNNNKNDCSYKDDCSKAALKAERDSSICKYGKRSYVNRLMDVFKSDNSGTSDYWVEVSE